MPWRIFNLIESADSSTRGTGVDKLRGKAGLRARNARSILVVLVEGGGINICWKSLATNVVIIVAHFRFGSILPR